MPGINVYIGSATVPTPGTGVEVTNAAGLIEASANASNEGKTVTLRGGSYGDVTLSANRASLVTFQAATGEQVNFSSLTFTGSNLKVVGVNVSGGVNFSGCNGCAVYYSKLGNSAQFGPGGVGGTNSTLFGCELHYATQPTTSEVDLVRMRSHNGIVVEQCWFHDHDDANSWHSDCAQAYTAGSTLTNATFRKNLMHGLNCQAIMFKDFPTSNVLLEDNLIFGTSGSWQLLQVWDCANVTLRRNTHWSELCSSIALRGSALSGITLDGNVVRKMYCEDQTTVDANTVLRRNNVISTDTFSSGTYAASDASPAPGTAPYSSLFVDSANGDWRLKPGAPNYGSAGVTWKAGDFTYGPAAVGAL